MEWGTYELHLMLDREHLHLEVTASLDAVRNLTDEEESAHEVLVRIGQLVEEGAKSVGHGMEALVLDTFDDILGVGLENDGDLGPALAAASPGRLGDSGTSATRRVADSLGRIGG